MKDHYEGITGIYFWRVLKKVVKIGDLKDKKVLDFGCGLKKLKTLIPNVISYDKDPLFTEVVDWKNQDFEVVVASQVFYEMTSWEVETFLNELRQVNPNALLILTISRHGWLNKLGAWLFDKDAHKRYKLIPQQEWEILEPRVTVLKKTSVFFMCDIYLTKLK